MFSFAAFEEIDTLITDARADPDAVEVLRSEGMSVLCA
jgi:DeoR/GlpR family transcriptional regulator of sugar metabolism